MIFERGTIADIYRKEILLGTVKIDIFSPSLHTLENRWNVGAEVDFEAYIELTIPLELFDIVKYDSKGYKVTSIQKYSNFYFVRGNKVEY